MDGKVETMQCSDSTAPLILGDLRGMVKVSSNEGATMWIWIRSKSGRRLMMAVGLALFIASYFLVAVAIPSDNAHYHLDIRGYDCARATLERIWDYLRVFAQGTSFGEWLMDWVVALSGLNNLLVPAYVLAKGTSKRWLGYGVAVSGGVFVPVALFHLHARVAIGCCLWLGGTLLILVSGWGRASNVTEEPPKVHVSVQDLHSAP